MQTYSPERAYCAETTRLDQLPITYAPPAIRLHHPLLPLYIIACGAVLLLLMMLARLPEPPAPAAAPLPAYVDQSNLCVGICIGWGR